MCVNAKDNFEKECN
jgi:hypothetical protein